MLKELTENQQIRIGEFTKKWTEIGFDKKPLDRDKVEQAVNLMYRCGGLENPRKIVYCASPMEMYLIIESFKRSENTKVEELLRESVSESVLSSARNVIADLVRRSDWGALNQSVQNSVTREVCKSIEQDVRASIGLQVAPDLQHHIQTATAEVAARLTWRAFGEAVWQSLDLSLENFAQSSGSKVFWAAIESPVLGQQETWLAAFDYFREVCGLTTETDQCAGLIECAKECGWIFPTPDICFVSGKPVEFHYNESGIPHNANGAAVEFSDGWGVYYLNGVRVPEIIAVTPADELSADFLITTPNAQIRAEIIKKIGMARVLKDLNAECLDASDDGIYELLMLDLKDGRIRPFLKMLNPSTFEYHIEGVEPGCRTVPEALNWRNGDRIWDKNGADWQQQGDVLIFPLGAKSYKPYPKIIT